MRGRRSLAALAAALVAGAAALFGGVAGSEPSDGPVVESRPEAVATQLLNGFAAGDTVPYIAALERRAAESEGRDLRALTLLGLAYQQRARETGDPSFYPRSEDALRRALRLDRRDDLAATGLAALAVSRHRFRDALALAERARRLNPARAAVYGVLGDALVELGRYDEAFAAFDRMAALKPSLTSYSRISYGRELLGRVDGAIEAMKLAVEAGSTAPENAAWTLVQLGNLYFDTGRLRPAERAYGAALARYPGYVHAEAALARVAAARGRYRRAAELYRRTVDTLPLPQYAIALGDVLTVAGRADEARAAYGVVDVIQRLFRANGVRTETETALFDLDHDRRLAGALVSAREAARKWPSIYTQDVLAWALYKNGRCEEARGHSRSALRLGTRDALKLFHRGMIELCLGERAEGRAFLRRALAVNPHFSLLLAAVARETLGAAEPISGAQRTRGAPDTGPDEWKEREV